MGVWRPPGWHPEREAYIAIHLSAHAGKLETANYIAIGKCFRGKVPYTEYRLTKQGRAAFKAYRAKLKWMLKALG